MKSKAELSDAGEALLLCEDMLVQCYKDWIDRERECMEIAREWRIPTDEFEELWEEWKDKREIEEWNAKPKVEVAKQPAMKEVIRENKPIADGIKPAVRDIEAKIKAKAEAEKAKAEADASLKNSEVQPSVEEPKIEIVKAEAEVVRMPGPKLKLINGRWYSVRGNDVRRWLTECRLIF